jgi:hypothetical protein
MSKKSLSLYCFSPPVMLATFTIEILFAAYILWRYKITVITRLVVSILAFLAIFQGTEYLLCGGMGVDGGTWSRIGYGAITLLPPLGLHLVHAIAGKKSRFLVPLSYLTAGAFITYFIFGVQAISGHTCYANYAVFDTKTNGGSFWYGLYYYGWLTTGAVTAWNFAKELPKQKSALLALMVGYLAFMVPTTVVNLIDPSTISAIPSIMCGFAVMLAFVLVGKVAPESIALRNPSKSIKLKLPY